MLDIKLIRKDPQLIEKKLRTKDPTISLTSLLELDQALRKKKTQVEQLKSTRNEISEKIGQLKRTKQDASKLMSEVKGISEEIHQLDHDITPLEEQFLHALSSLPNLPMDDILVSQNPQDNVVIKEYGSKPTFSFPFKNHVELNEALDLFDFKRAARMSGTGWPLYKGLGARLEWALINYMVDIQVKNGFLQVLPPLLVRRDTMFHSGQLPKFETQLFKIHDPDYHLYLIPTSEIPLNGLHAEETISEEELPLKYTAFTPCFRREAGAAGSQERGLIRMHQFHKVEMFAFTKPDASAAMMEEMLNSADEVLEGLGLHYRHTLLVTGDTSFGAARTVDIEVWLPGQNRYYEVSSVSNCTDFQARRSHTRYKSKDGSVDLVHTLNGSGLATSRLMVALLENNQNEDGSVHIPQVLQKYLNGISRLEDVH